MSYKDDACSPCEVKEARKAPSRVPKDGMSVAKYLFARERSTMLLKEKDGTIKAYSEDIHAMIVRFDPKRPPKVKAASMEEMVEELAHLGLS